MKKIFANEWAIITIFCGHVFEDDVLKYLGVQRCTIENQLDPLHEVK